MPGGALSGPSTGNYQPNGPPMLRHAQRSPLIIRIKMPGRKAIEEIDDNPILLLRNPKIPSTKPEISGSSATAFSVLRYFRASCSTENIHARVP